MHRRSTRLGAPSSPSRPAAMAAGDESSGEGAYNRSKPLERTATTTRFQIQCCHVQTSTSSPLVDDRPPPICVGEQLTPPTTQARRRPGSSSVLFPLPNPSRQRLQQLQQASRPLAPASAVTPLPNPSPLHPLAPATIAHKRPPICSSCQRPGRRRHNPIPSRPPAVSITAWPTSESELDCPNNGTLIETQLMPITWASQQQIRRSNPTAPKIRHYPISKWPTPTSTQKLLFS